MKVLMITSCFAPKNIIGAVRLSKIAKYMIRDGCELTVISPVLEDYDTIDNMLECDEFEKATRITIPYSKVTSTLTRLHKKDFNRNSESQIGNQINISIKARIYRGLRNLFSWWRNYEWTKKVNKYIHVLPETYDVVFSSHPNTSTHDSAYFAKRKGKAISWVADFRDPIVLESSVGNERKRLTRRQSQIVARADLVTHVSKAGVEHFICSSSDKEKVIWVPNGFDEDDFTTIAQILNRQTIGLSDQLIFAYAGGLYSGERDCSPLFKAVRELIDEGEISLEDIRVDYAGRDYGILRKQADKYGVSDIIHNKGLVPRKESIEMQATSDCVIVATFCYTDGGGAMTGKIYEPIMMRRPILMMVNGPGKNSEPGMFVKYLNAGTVYEESIDKGDISAIKKMILEMIKEKKINQYVESHIDEGRRDEYNYSSIAKKLIELMRGL